MTDLPDLIALSLLPSWTWRHAAEQLRAGTTPKTVLADLLARRTRAQPDASTFGERADRACRRAMPSGGCQRRLGLRWRDSRRGRRTR